MGAVGAVGEDVGEDAGDDVGDDVGDGVLLLFVECGGLIKLNPARATYPATSSTIAMNFLALLPMAPQIRRFGQHFLLVEVTKMDCSTKSITVGINAGCVQQ